MPQEIKNISPFFKEEKLILKSMKPGEKIRLALRLYYSARKLKFFGIKDLHPDWSDEEVLRKVREVFLYART
jgi:hypothetical protein